MRASFVFPHVIFLFLIRFLQSKFFVFPLGCNEFALFKSVEQINRFKKQHFLNRFEQNNRFKKCTQGASPKNLTFQGTSQKKKITGGKIKLAHGESTYLP
jgi:D-lyxose ketol-isomerase